MKSSFLKIFAGHFQRYLQWLQCQKIQDKRRRQLTTRANHYLAYLSLSSSDFSKTFKTVEGQQKAWRNYRRFLKESMNYQDDGLRAAFDELAFFHSFVDRTAEEGASIKSVVGDTRGAEVKVVHLLRETRGKRLSARPGDEQKTGRAVKKTSTNK
ncbi:MAG: hypothetical protein P4L53_24940 [Candidatus Obscuribacterales bacterium]|nr:hypothetical protein [Candidatus Obscuribacterales bacterium]